MTHLLRIDRASVEPTVERPDPAKVLDGDPVHTTWLHEDRNGLYCGMWQTTPGKWAVSYSEWEYIRVISGVSILTDEKGVAFTMKAGDSFVIRPGFKGTWDCIETTLKDFVIRE